MPLTNSTYMVLQLSCHPVKHQPLLKNILFMVVISNSLDNFACSVKIPIKIPEGSGTNNTF